MPPAQFRVTGTITLTPSVYNTVECTGTFTAKTTPSATPPVIPSGIVDKLKTTNATMDTRMNTMSALASANESNDSYPISVANKLMERLVAAVRTLHETYANYAAVDESMYRQFLAGIPTAPPLTASEKSIITTNLTFDDHEAQLAKLEVTRAHGVTAPSTPTKCTAPNMWHRIPSTVKSPVAYFQVRVAVAKPKARRPLCEHSGVLCVRSGGRHTAPPLFTHVQAPLCSHLCTPPFVHTCVWSPCLHICVAEVRQ